MDGTNIEMLIRMPASTSGRSPPLILSPIRPNMAPETRRRTTGFEANQLSFSGGVITYITPPQATNPQNDAQNVPPDDGTMIGMTAQVSLIIFSIIIVFLICRNRRSRWI